MSGLKKGGDFFIRKLLEVAPFLIFLYTYRNGVHQALAVLAVTLVVFQVIIYKKFKVISKRSILVKSLIFILILLSVVFDSDVFMQFRTSVISFFVALFLLYEDYQKRYFTKQIFEKYSFDISLQAHKTLSRRFIKLLFFISILHIIIWVSGYGDNIILRFKSLILLLLFILYHIPFIKQNKIEKKEEEKTEDKD